MFVLVVVPLGDELGYVFVVGVDEGGEPDGVLPRDAAVYHLLEQPRVTVMADVKRGEKPHRVQPTQRLQYTTLS